MSLVKDMQALGFDTCDVAANAQDAFLQAMENLPDIVLMDVNLEGGREGIEAARSLREVGDVPVVLSLRTLTLILSSASMNRFRKLR